MYKVLIFGTGGLAQYLYKHKAEETTIVAFLSSFEANERCIEGIPVVSIEEVNQYIYDYVVIAFSDVEKGKRILNSLGVENRKIVGYSCNSAYDYAENPYQKECDKTIKGRLLTENIAKLFLVSEKRYYLCSMNVPETKEVIEHDFVREQTLALCAKEINRKKVVGVCAELGVFQGKFARKINSLFPDKKIYLFDTFESFSEKDYKSDSSLNWGNSKEAFRDTGVEKVKECMPYPEKVSIKQGYFPETFDLQDEIFAFVSIDADLYNPIKSGLEIFYPRLAKGGYIMVHDYNNIVYGGATNAVQEYCDERGISYVPIPDMAGSIVITK